MGRDHGICSSYTWNRVLTFTMPKTITLLVWQIGLLHKILQGAVIGYLVWSLYDNSTWAYKEVPIESVNAFVEIAASSGWDEATDVYNAETAPAWCADPGYAFKWSASYDYTNVSCLPMNSHECSKKKSTTSPYSSRQIREGGTALGTMTLR